MTVHRLRLTASDAVLAGLRSSDLLWQHDGDSSVKTSFGPTLAEMGPVAPLHVDLVRIACGVFFCDRTVNRPRGLRRDFEIDLPVSDPARWEASSSKVEALLGVLTGDVWRFSFRRGREPQAGQSAEPKSGDLALLFSGGADSAAGAVSAFGEGHKPVVVSHHDWTSIRGQQRRVLDQLEAATGEQPPNVSFWFATRKEQVGSGQPFGNEPTRRSRSFLFIALGLAAASQNDSPLWIAENGFTSLNPPLAAERRGAMSTRTTHPSFLQGLSETLSEVGLRAELVNPYADLSKGQVFSEIKDILGEERASKYLSSSNSCAKPQRLKGFAPDAPCGVCMGCLVRRGAFVSSGISDQTVYVEEALLNDPSEREKWFSAQRRKTLQAISYRATIGFSEEDILELGLPDDADVDAALALANRGLEELASVEVS